ncbi:MAG: WD40 repeat domain-containing protein, partial [Planctomycetaceae bacterium]
MHIRTWAGRSLRWCLLVSWAISGAVLAQEAAPAPAAPPAAEAPPLVFARRDLARWQALLETGTKAVAERQAQLEAVTKGVADAKAAQAVAAKAAVDAAAAVTAAEQAKAAAEKALAAAIETKTAADAAKITADAKVPEVEGQVKPATEAKAAADAQAKLAQEQATAAQARLASLEKLGLKPNPEATRLTQTATHDRPLLAVRFDPQANWLLAGAQDNALHRWDLGMAPLQHQPGHGSWVGALQVNGPRKEAVAGSHEGKLIWWADLDTTPRVVREVAAHRGYLRAIAVSPDGNLIATGGNDLVVRVWSAADGSLVKELPGHERHVYNVAFDPTGKFLVSGD